MLAVTLVATGSQSLHAQPKHIPAGEKCEVGKPPERRQCYRLEDYKSLLQFDVSFGKCLEREKVHIDKEENLKKQIEEFRGIVDSQQKSILLLQDDRKRMFDMWKNENRKRHLAENRPKFGSWIAWGTAGVFVVATAVLTGVVIAKN